MAGGNFGGGDGTKDNPFLVEDAQDLNAVRNHLTSYFSQTADIDLSIYPDWSTIPNEPDPQSTNLNRFLGSYQGNGFNISNLRIRSSNSNNCGLFSYYVPALPQMSLSGINLVNADVSIINGSRLGILCGMSDGMITDCHSSGVVNLTTSNNYLNGVAGGLLGNNNQGFLVHCSSTANVVSNQSSGGLAGRARQIEDCFATGNVSGVSAGGLMGICYSNESHKRCYSSGVVSGSYSAGGLAGRAFVYSYKFDNCFALNPKIKKTLASATNSRFNDLTGDTSEPTVVKNCYSLDSMVFEL